MCYRVINFVELYYIFFFKMIRVKFYMYFIFLFMIVYFCFVFFIYFIYLVILGIYVILDLCVIDFFINLLRMFLIICLKFN